MTIERAKQRMSGLLDRKKSYCRDPTLSLSLTTHLLKADDINDVKLTEFIVNTPRGPIVDETALIHVLKPRKISSATLDAFDVEPPP